MAATKIRIDYAGSKGWLIFWVLVFFPIATVLFITGGKFEMDGKKHYVVYEGSRGWLCFWTVVFFPVAAILVLLNGFSVVLGETAV